MSRKYELSGQRFGKLTVVSSAKNGNDGHTRWLCRCDCGRTILAESHRLARGQRRACRHCAHRKDKPGGEYRAKLLNLWWGMIKRCHDPNDRAFARYGGRNIFVCQRWRDSFDAFVIDMGNRPTPKHQIDRIDNNGPYSPENCHWVTSKQNNRNRRNNRFLTWRGRTQCVSAWAEEFHVHASALFSRLRTGWTPERLLSTLDEIRPVQKSLF